MSGASCWEVCYLTGGLCHLPQLGLQIAVDLCQIGPKVEFPTRPQGDTKWFLVETEFGTCRVLGRPEVRTSKRPVAVFIHGLGRQISDIWPGVAMAERCADVLLLSLPGVQTDEIAVPSIDNIAKMYLCAIRAVVGARPSLIIGESVGGLVALAMAPGVDRVVLIDPPLTMSDQWPIWWSIEHSPPGSLGFPKTLLDECVGTSPEASEQISYLHLVKDGSKVRVICGAEPLLPPRDLKYSPSLVKPEEIAYMRACGATVDIIPGGHALMDHAREEVARVIAEELARPPFCS